MSLSGLKSILALARLGLTNRPRRFFKTLGFKGSLEENAKAYISQ
jgi:hypothetical protein